MRWDIELRPRAEARLTFPEEGHFGYGVSSVEGNDRQTGTITVDNQASTSGVNVILILEGGLEPVNVTIKAHRSVIWKNRRNETVRFFSL
ncbi:hypothetical protein MYX64_04325 [Nitrospinae bacterium AH_259_B05_G02_I21]|nr:hypothetical protein [Nitrospinae bacterium AH_259_B05_G02_I21]